ncbi:hypothetical protein CCAX7_61370 [Capsulimonas corticalis]|uniref:Uncharacterized protein n=2 Tax=Capsulimonas corticalis TaxID=2219043 RepID=A0A402CWB6_9BACT|nr:hypothetical protein CCAX7_61370 [Capsulimonas corticalis]
MPLAAGILMQRGEFRQNDAAGDEKDLSKQADSIDTSAPMSDGTLEFAVELFSSFSNPTRLKIVELLTERERTVGEIAHDLGLLQPNVSQHLTILSRAGVVKSTRDGASHCYSLRGPRIAQILKLVNEFQEVHRAHLENLSE